MRWAWSVVASALAIAGGCRGSSSGVAPPTSTASPAPSPSAATPSPSAPAPAAVAALRDEARLVLERHCGQCHVRDSPAALPRALAVYDLREPDWSVRMTDAQLHAALGRLDEPLPPDGQPSAVSPDERARFGAYIDAELARRARKSGGGAR